MTTKLSQICPGDYQSREIFEAEELKARTVKQGGRLRYGIAPEEAQRYISQEKLRQKQKGIFQ